MNITQIYLVENCYGDPNKVYIGKTINKTQRKNAHKKTFGKQIEYTIIDHINSVSRKDWKPLETYWIQQFKVWGFKVMNIRMGGGSGPEFWTEDWKKHHSQVMKGKLKPIGFAEKISRANKGKKRSIEQKLHYHGPKSKETCRKISEAKKGCSYPTLQKPVCQYDINENFIKKYNSISEANYSLNKNPNNSDIALSCNGKRKIVYGFIWKWKNS